MTGSPPQVAVNSRNRRRDGCGRGLGKVGISGLKGVAEWFRKLRHDNEF